MTITHEARGNRLDWTVEDRMHKALRVSGVSVLEMADYLGLARNTVGNYMSGRTRPNKGVLRLWAIRTGVPLDWLRDGTAPKDGGPDGLPREDSNLQPTDIHLLHVKRHLVAVPERLAVAA